jgi:hypothetical protein
MDTFTILGYPWGYSTTIAKAIKFNVINGDLPHPVEGYISIEAYNSLPSYCPFLKYKIEVREKEGLYLVERVLCCEKRGTRINKYELSDYFTYCQSIKLGGNEIQDRTPNESKVVISRISKFLPVDITNKEMLVKQTKLLGEENLEKIMKVVEPFFKDQNYLDLLRYFPQGFLNKMNEDELKYIRCAIGTNPDILCFPGLSARIFSEFDITIGGKTKASTSSNPWKDKFFNKSTTIKLFTKNGGLNKLYTSPLFCSNPESGERISYARIATGEKDGVHYDQNFPFLNIKTLKCVCDDFDIAMDTDLVKEALRYYLKCEEIRKNFGRTVFNFTSDLLGISLEALHYLMEKDILRVYESAMIQRTHVSEITENLKASMPDTEICEWKLIETLKEKVDLQNVRVYQCPLYGKPYFDALGEYVGNAKGVSLVISSGVGPAFDLSRQTSFEVHPIQDILSKKTGKNVLRGVQNLFIDKFNKLGTQDFLDLLLMIESKDKITLSVFGDSNEYSVHPKTGGFGELFMSFASEFVPKILDVEGYIEADEDNLVKSNPRKIVMDLCDGVADSVTQEIVKIESVIQMYQNYQKKLKAILKQEKKASKSERIQLVVSNESDKKMLLEQLHKKSSRKFSQGQYWIGSLVVVHKLGLFGTIKKAHLLSTSGNYTELNSRRTVKLYSGVYKLEVQTNLHGVESYFDVEEKPNKDELMDDDLDLQPKQKKQKVNKDTSASSVEKMYTTNTSDCEISNGEVTTIREFMCTPVEYIAFFVGEKTRRADLINAAKYCTKGIMIITTSARNIKNAMDRLSKPQALTSLGSKLIGISGSTMFDDL